MLRLLSFVLILIATPAFSQRLVPPSDLVFYVTPPAINGVCNPVGYWAINPSTDVNVTACGDDGPLGDGTQAHPFATPQHAFDVAYSKYDFQCNFGLTVLLAARLRPAQNYYPGIQLSGRAVGQCGTMQPLFVAFGMPPYPIGKFKPFVLRGDPNNVLGAWLNPGNVQFNFPATIPALSLTEGAALRVYGLGVDTSNAPMDCTDHFTGAYLELDTVAFGNCGNPQNPTIGGRLGIGQGWRDAGLMITGPISINGMMGDFFQGSGWTYGNNNGPQGASIDIAVYNNPIISEAFWICDNCYAYIANMTIHGAYQGATRSMVVMRNGVVETNHGTTPTSCPASYFPGVGKTVVVEDNSVCR